MWVLRKLPPQIDCDMHNNVETEEVQHFIFLMMTAITNTLYMRLGIGVMNFPAFRILSWCYRLSHRDPNIDF